MATSCNKTDKMSMEKRTSLASVLAAATVGRAAKLLVAVLLAAAAMTSAVPERADAQEAVDPSDADSDGYVPIYEVCSSEELAAANSRGVGYDVTAAYVPDYDGYSVEGYILLDVCVLERLGAGPNDIQRILEHEYGHAAGYPDSDDPSSFMYWHYGITGT